MPADEESFGRTAVPGRYTGPGPEMNTTASLLVDRLWRLIYILFSLFVLHKMAFYSAILKSPLIRHEWFKVGLGLSIAFLGIKAYVEMYEGLIRKQKVDYKNFKHTTHAAILLIMLTGVAFNVALWPYYGWNSPIALGLFFFGVVLQFLIIVPTWLQNLVAFVGLTFFLQEYQ